MEQCGQRGRQNHAGRDGANGGDPAQLKTGGRSLSRSTNVARTMPADSAVATPMATGNAICQSSNLASIVFGVPTTAIVGVCEAIPALLRRLVDLVLPPYVANRAAQCTASGETSVTTCAIAAP